MQVQNWYLGTMGYAHDEWLGVFYPQGMSPRNYLTRYVEVFNAAELDTTFYGIPRESTVQRWRAVAPPDFVFCPKLPKEISHELRLRNAQALLERFLASLQPLKSQLGAILIQLSPDFSPVERGSLVEFLTQLPKTFAFAVEFRQRGWYQPATAELLARHGVAWACTEYAPVPRQLHCTADFLYIRWIGDHGRFPYRHDHELIDPSENLQWWLAEIAQQPAHTLYGFFNNEYANFSPASCNRFKRLVGLPTAPLEPPQQMSLFDI
ncbi:MAG TPA: DUF72 domain-containing protein [Anaerolineales bacterium]|nr:DUF72 domain-containing protein [Anaerolineales bacterium]